MMCVGLALRRLIVDRLFMASSCETFLRLPFVLVVVAVVVVLPVANDDGSFVVAVAFGISDAGFWLSRPSFSTFKYSKNVSRLLDVAAAAAAATN